MGQMWEQWRMAVGVIGGGAVAPVARVGRSGSDLPGGGEPKEQRGMQRDVRGVASVGRSSGIRGDGEDRVMKPG